jgi:enoyl-CoA hydratase/carnithine racemase
MNAMSFNMWQDLDSGAARLADDPAVRVVVLAGADGRNFCAGGDISEFSELRSGAAAMEKYDLIGKGATDRIKQLPKPTIAMIHGYCLGGGMGLAANCDLRIAADDAKLGIPAAKRALSYSFDGLRLLVGLVGPSQAKRIMFTGSSYDAQESLRIGLVDEVVGAAGLRDHVVALAQTIASNAPLSVAASKFIIDMLSGDQSKYDVEACRAREAECLASADYAEATRAFIEKRPPLFTGR